MSISSTVRKAGPFVGSGTASVFAFPFKVFQKQDLAVVILAVATGVQSTLTLDSDYSVALNANQDFSPGGTITLTNGALPAGYNLVIASAALELQGVDLTNQGGFYPEVVTAEFDLLTILIQQLQEQVDRGIEFPITDPSGINTQLPPVAQRANMYLTFDENGNPVTIVAAPGQTSPQTLSFGYLETTSTAGQTVFATPPYTPGSNNLIVTTGGLLLAVGVDYTETSPTSITMTSPTPAQDIFTFRSILASGFVSGNNTPYVLVVPYAASVTLNAGLADGFYIAGMTGNLTIAGVWGLTAGQPIAMFYQQDATGGRTVTFPAIMVGAAQPDPAANAISVQTCACDAVTGQLRATGPLFSVNGAFFAGGINTTGAVVAASGAFAGAVAAGSVAATGAITAATASVGSIAAATAVVSGSLGAGAVTAGSLTLVAPGVAGQVLANAGGVFVATTLPSAGNLTTTDVTAERAYGVAYQNTSPNPRIVNVVGNLNAGVANNASALAYVGPTSVSQPLFVCGNSVANGPGWASANFTVAPGQWYIVKTQQGTDTRPLTLVQWVEQNY
jgi:hypothetical protein